MRKGRYTLTTVLVIVATLIILFMSTGCSGYRHYNFYNSLYDCYFEYPATHHIVRVTDDKNTVWVSVYMSVIGLLNTTDEHIWVNIKRKSDLFQNYSDWIQDTLDFYQKGSNRYDFVLVSRQKISVDHSEGEMFYYTFNRIEGEPKVKNNQLVWPKIIPALSYTACFEKGNYLFKLENNAIAERSEQAKTHFNHLLATFKFLE